MAYEVYSSAEVNIAWGGVPFKGLAGEGFVTITPNSDVTVEDIGADSGLSTSISPDRTGTVVIQLQQVSPTNRLLGGLITDQLTGSKKFKRADLTIVDPSGSVIVLCKGAYIKGRPEITLGSSTEGNYYSWTFYCEELIYTAVPEGVSSAIKNSSADQLAGAISILNGLNR